MRHETIAFVLAVVVPPMFVHFSLLAEAYAINIVGAPPDWRQFRRREVFLPATCSVLLGLGGMIPAWVSYRMIEEVIVRTMTACGFLPHEQTFNGIQGPSYLLLSYCAHYALRKAALRTVPLGYFVILRVWLMGAIIYGGAVGWAIYFTITVYYLPGC